jgi:hypothetical protein
MGQQYDELKKRADIAANTLKRCGYVAPYGHLMSELTTALSSLQSRCDTLQSENDGLREALDE